MTRTKNYSRADEIDPKFIRDSNSPLNCLTFQSPIIRELETIKYAHDTKGQSTGFAIDWDITLRLQIKLSQHIFRCTVVLIRFWRYIWLVGKFCGNQPCKTLLETWRHFISWDLKWKRHNSFLIFTLLWISAKFKIHYFFIFKLMYIP